MSLVQRFGSVEQLLEVAWAERWPRRRTPLLGSLTNTDLDPGDRLRFFVLDLADQLRDDPRSAAFVRIVFLDRALPEPSASQVSTWRDGWRGEVEAAFGARERGRAIDPVTGRAWLEILAGGLAACAVLPTPAEVRELADRVLA